MVRAMPQSSQPSLLGPERPGSFVKSIACRKSEYPTTKKRNLAHDVWVFVVMVSRYHSPEKSELDGDACSCAWFRREPHGG